MIHKYDENFTQFVSFFLLLDIIYTEKFIKGINI